MVVEKKASLTIPTFISSVKLQITQETNFSLSFLLKFDSTDMDSSKDLKEFTSDARIADLESIGELALKLITNSVQISYDTIWSKRYKHDLYRPNYEKLSVKFTFYSTF